MGIRVIYSMQADNGTTLSTPCLAKKSQKICSPHILQTNLNVERSKLGLPNMK